MIIHNPFIRLYNHYNLYMGNYITHQFHLNVDIPYITGDRKPYIAGTMGTMSTMICLSMNNPRMFCLLYIYIYILYTETYLCIIYIYICVYLCLFVHTHMGASQNRRSGTSSGTTPVPYPRSIPPFHTSLKDPFHTSVPYLWSIRYYIIIIYIYMYLYIYIYVFIYVCIYIYIYVFIYIYTWICAVWFYICTRILERTYTHECVHARIGLLCPSPVIVLSSLCLQRLLCDGRDVLGCCQLAV